LRHDCCAVGPRRLRNPPICNRTICGHRRRPRRENLASNSRMSSYRGFL
jgi:hypothetical protein